MIDYLADVKTLQDQGLSPSDIVSHLNSKTATPMNPEQCRYILQDTGAVLTDPVTPDQRTGSLISYYQGLPDGDAKKLIAFFISRIYGGEVVRTDQWPRSVQFKSVEDSLPTELQSVSAELVRSAGGRAASVTEADVTAAQQAWEDQEAQRLAQLEADRQAAEQAELQRQQAEQLNNKYISLYNSNIAPLIDSQNSNDDDWVAAIQNIANNWSV
jgi:hypothetical protein